jgi:hypothetical protein
VPGAKRRLARLLQDGESGFDAAIRAIERVAVLSVEEAIELDALMTHALLCDLWMSTRTGPGRRACAPLMAGVGWRIDRCVARDVQQR